MSKKEYILSRFDIDGLFEIGFVKTKTDFEAIEKRIVTWFGLQSIYEYDDIGEDKPKELKAENIFSDN